MGAPVFFSEHVDAAIADKPVDEQLSALATLIQDAEFAKLSGYGPPADELRTARRRWLTLYDQWAAENLPYQERKFA
ncbi:hypothetical protein ACVILI_003101 [Mesorhizobium sp. USDA 4775]|uniref:hypothetical protein n=1 Tax=Mesorhizobium sp. WSM4310 TaxID=2589883 RepID=UPI00115C7CCD|nr:hypothetical protein [Mesorhizobium sp. WSM4310]TRC78550.1 hypothetical protein FJV80_24730 [Mesorhizobium sp. WSM4310]